MKTSWSVECTTLSLVILLAFPPKVHTSTESHKSHPLASNYNLSSLARNVDDQSSSLNSTSIHPSNDRVKRRTKLPNNLMPEFAAPIGNVTAVLGRDIRLICTVDNLGQYQVSCADLTSIGCAAAKMLTSQLSHGEEFTPGCLVIRRIEWQSSSRSSLKHLKASKALDPS